MLRYIKGATVALLLKGIYSTFGLKDPVTAVVVVEGRFVEDGGVVGLDEVGFEVGAGVTVDKGGFG